MDWNRVLRRRGDGLDRMACDQVADVWTSGIYRGESAPGRYLLLRYENPQEVYFIADKPFVVAIVFGLNMATVIAYVSTQCAYQLVLQRMTQVLTVVMTSHMFLHLKGTNSRAREGAVSTNVVFGTLVDREKYTHDRYHSIFRSTDQSGVEVDDWKPGK
jgi:hypothetical protein